MVAIECLFERALVYDFTAVKSAPAQTPAIQQ